MNFAKLKNITSFQVVDSIILIMPILFILGSPWTNFSTFVFSFLFLYICFKENNWSWIKKKWVIFFLVFWFYNIINGFFSTNSFAAIKTSFFYIRFLFFSLIISFYGFRYIKLNKILKFWVLCLSFVIFDLFIQFTFKIDLFGYPEQAGGRYAGLFGEELIAGSFLSRFIPFVIPFIFFHRSTKLSKITNIFPYFFIIITFVAILISGERTNFLVFFIYALLFGIYYFWEKKIKIFYLLLFFLIIFFSLLQLKSVQSRYVDFKNIALDFKSSSYGKLWNSGYELWKLHPWNGVGFKNFRVDCDIEIIDTSNNTHPLCSSHPHNLYLEILSETGLIGFCLFSLYLFFIFKEIIYNFSFVANNQSKDLYVSSSILICIILIPVLTSGSFYTSLNGLYIWLHIAFINYLSKNTKKY